ncbi:hypothetical protein ACX40Y_14620 [Sphingomonas sp. RS6]
MTLRFTVLRAAALACCSMAAGCGGGDPQEASAADKVGTLASVAGAAAGRPISVADLPAFAQIYPGGKVISHLKMNDAGQRAGTVTYTSDASAADIVAFYKKSFAANGIAIQAEADTGAGYMLTGADDASSKQLVVTITDEADERVRTVSLVHSSPIAANSQRGI